MSLSPSYYIPDPPKPEEDNTFTGFTEKVTLKLMTAVGGIMGRCAQIDSFVAEDTLFSTSEFRRFYIGLLGSFVCFSEELHINLHIFRARSVIPTRDWNLYERIAVATRIIFELEGFSKIEEPAGLTVSQMNNWHKNKIRKLNELLNNIRDLFKHSADFLEKQRDQIMRGSICWPFSHRV